MENRHYSPNILRYVNFPDPGKPEMDKSKALEAEEATGLFDEKTNTVH